MITYDIDVTPDGYTWSERIQWFHDRDQAISFARNIEDQYERVAVWRIDDETGDEECIYD